MAIEGNTKLLERIIKLDAEIDRLKEILNCNRELEDIFAIQRRHKKEKERLEECIRGQLTITQDQAREIVAKNDCIKELETELAAFQTI
jgi:hypothetical protein